MMILDKTDHEDEDDEVERDDMVQKIEKNLIIGLLFRTADAKNLPIQYDYVSFHIAFPHNVDCLLDAECGAHNIYIECFTYFCHITLCNERLNCVIFCQLLFRLDVPRQKETHTYQ